MKWGANIDLIITDQYSHRSPGADAPEAGELFDEKFPYFVPQEEYEIIDAGASYNGGHPPATLKFGDKEFPNSRRDKTPPTFLGVEQTAWLRSEIKRARAPWKIWGNSLPTLTWRSDPQNLPPDAPKWPGGGYAQFGGADWSTQPTERGEIFDAIREAGITGLTILAGDRHSFWAGLPSKSLPPKPFDPVGLEFIVGSISSPGALEAAEHRLPKDLPLRGMYLRDRPGSPKPEHTMNMLVRHGVRSAIEYGKSGDIATARALSNPDCSPHLSFVDIAGHGYATVKVTPDSLDTEFVCIERPVTRSTSPDGGPLRYRVLHHARLWKKGEPPKLEQRVIEGDPRLSI
jgi:alkaline phosphatase D